MTAVLASAAPPDCRELGDPPGGNPIEECERD